MESPEKTKAILNQINNNWLEMKDELEIFQVIFYKYNFMTISEYAKKHGFTYEGVKHRIKARSVQFIEVKGKIFLFN